MERNCLVLNAQWVPIETVSWQDAFTKVFNGRAKVVEYYEETVRTPNDEYLKPAVIVCTEFSSIPPRLPIYSKRAVYNRDNWLCQYCKVALTSDNATIDHVLPRSKGGRSTFENTVCACYKCNSKKADKTLEEAKMKLLKAPTVPKSNPVRAKFGRIAPMAIEEPWKPHLRKYMEIA